MLFGDTWYTYTVNLREVYSVVTPDIPEGEEDVRDFLMACKSAGVKCHGISIEDMTRIKFAFTNLLEYRLGRSAIQRVVGSLDERYSARFSGGENSS